jgi:uncharacterized repeat protein (TIGR01451 family)
MKPAVTLLIGFLFCLSIEAQIASPGTAGAIAGGRMASAGAAATPSGVNTSAVADFYVSPAGNDAWPGTLSQPFQTLDRARRAVQALKAGGIGRAITVLLRGGIYYLPATWTLTAADSGTAAAPIVYANYPGERPMISGGRRLTGWTQNSNGSWRMALPLGTYFTQLWVNGVRRYRPRTTPNGYLFITGEYSTTGSTTQVNQLSYATPPAEGVPATMANLADVELIAFEAWDVPHLRIASVNTSLQRITTTASLTKDRIYHGFIPGHHFLLENVKEALKQPGQFYLDRPTSVLTYIPQAGETLGNTTIIAPRLQKLLSASNLSYITFQGLVFAHSDWQVPASGYLSGQAESGTPAAITLTNSAGVIFESDSVEHTGGYGIEFLGTGAPATPGSFLAQFRNGLITDTGAGGIRVGGRVYTCNTNDKVPQRIYIGNNLITGGGRVAPVGFAVLVGDAHHISVERNEIADFYNTGVAVGFNWNYSCNLAHDNVVQFNHIHDLGHGVTSDLGAVYFLSGINSGNKILNNKVHDIAHDPAGYGGWGLYTDAGAMGVLVQNNLVYRTTDATLHVNSAPTAPPGGAPPNVFRNNILAYGALGAMSRHNDTTFLSFLFENNIFYYDQPAIQYGYWYCQGQTACTDYFKFNNNLYFNKTASGGQPSQPFFKTSYSPMNDAEQPPVSWLTFEQWRAQGEDLNSRFADPLFINPAPGTDNYALDAASPALTLGFVAFDANQAGRLPTATLQAPMNAPGYPTLSSISGDLSLTASPSAGVVARGATLTYTYVVTNKGPNDSDGDTITTTIPSGTTYVNSTTTNGNCTRPAIGGTGTFSCTRTALLLTAHSWGPITLTVKVNAASGTVLKNTASVTAKTADAVPVNNSVTLSVKVQ